MDEDFEARIRETLAAAPRVPGLDWALLLAVNTLRVLETEMPGFKEKVRQRTIQSAQMLEQSDDLDEQSDAPSVRALLDSWVFKE